NDGRINGVTPWAEVQCWSQADTDNLQPYQVVEYEVDTENNPAAIVGSGTSVTPVGASQMTSLRNMDVVVANWHGINGPNRTDRVHPTVAQAVKNMQEQGKTRFGNGRPIFQVTAAYTNGVGHSTNSQHYRGTAV